MRYPVYEFFFAFQGEGCHSGRAAFFIRLSGCPVQCHWCDSAGTWAPGFTKAPTMMTETDLADLVAAESHANSFVVITGGEPGVFDLRPLIERLHAIGRRVHVETSGVGPAANLLGADWVTVSPKAEIMPPNPGVVRMASEFKIIVDDMDSIATAYKAIAGRRKKAVVWLHPQWGKRASKDLLGAICDHVKADGVARAGWQIHKEYDVDRMHPGTDTRNIPLGGRTENQ